MKNITRKILSEALNEVSPILTGQIAYDDKLVLWYNKEGILDSLALVSFISAVETIVLETLGKKITIVSEKAFSQQHSPFKSMEILGGFIEELLQEA
jgi:hypothetical protein